jgi:Ser/Thr protein kinase RdoA (MazF antagonist)
MDNLFPVTYSTPSVEALVTYALSNYNIELPTDCRFLKLSFNDTFLIDTQNTQYILRVYRKDWRSLSDILYELEALLHLKREGIAVSVPIPREDGNLVGTIMAPEGLRYLVLFTHAPGKEPVYDAQQEHQSYLYGKAVAKVHAATDTFQSSHHRFALDLEYLLDIPLQSFKPFLSHRLEDWEYIVRLADKLRLGIQKLSPDSLEIGFCHGDLYYGNAHFDQDQTLTFFDFDFCGMGWRADDIAVFRIYAHLNGKEKEIWPSFLRGYTEERNLSDADIQATKYFMAIRYIWLLGLDTNYVNDWGSTKVNDRYFDSALKFIHKWETEYLEGKPINLDIEH